MSPPYAEVIGDPIAQSKSPLIHRHWLAELGLAGDYRATRVERSALSAFLAARRRDADWRGCNVTIPHKEAVLPLLDRIEPAAEAVGAVNCVYRGPEGLVGGNTDVEGVRAALAGAAIERGRAVVIGGGGGARAAIRHLLDRQVATLTLLVRDPKKAEQLRADFGERVVVEPLRGADAALAGAAVIVNASPMGMAGAPPMGEDLLASIARHAEGAWLLDMVYKPLETGFLATGRANGGTAVDGLAMLIGQARTAFARFFGSEPPPDDRRVRDLLTT